MVYDTATGWLLLPEGGMQAWYKRTNQKVVQVCDLSPGCQRILDSMVWTLEKQQEAKKQADK